MPADAPDAVIFDNDGLTLDTEIVWTRAEETLFERRGLRFTHEHKLELVGSAQAIAAAKLATMLGVPAADGPAVLAELHGLVLEELAKGCEPMPGALELIDALRAAGTPIALCSNSPRAFLDLAVRTGGLCGRFGAMISADEVPNAKPAPDPYLAAAAALGVEAAGCVALEDSPTGAASAQAAGMHVIGVPSVPGVRLDGVAHEVHDSLEEPELWEALGLTTSLSR